MASTLKNENKENTIKQSGPGDLGKRAGEVYKILTKKYPSPKSLLDYSNPFELLVATILAAQCTDERVNKVTPDLFKRFPGPEQLAKAGLEEIEAIIRSTGFFHQKAKSIRKTSQALVDSFHGVVPQSIDDLASLPGVGRKTANVVAGNCFGIPAIMVDTHFKRVVGRLGLSTAQLPDKIESEIRDLVPENIQTNFTMVINFHGRYCCKARKPLCPGCDIRGLCPYPDKTL